MLLHKLVALLALALAANLDNLGVGIAYGIRRARISAVSNFLIALLAVGLTFEAMVFGQWVARILPIQVANDLGAAIIIGVGMWIYWESSDRSSRFPIPRKLRRQFLAVLTRWLPVFVRGRRRITPRVATVSSNSVLLQKQAQEEYLQVVSLQETLILGISLALNAMAGGLGASLSGYNPLTTSVAIGLFSYITVDVGQRFAKSYFSRWLGTLSKNVSGLLLISIGTYELFS